MGKMSDLAIVADELRKCGELLVGVSEALSCIFGEDVFEPSVLEQESSGTPEPADALESEPIDTSESESSDEPEPVVTREQVRAMLIDKIAAGRRSEAQALIQEFGAKNLSGVAPEKYAELLARAEVL